MQQQQRRAARRDQSQRGSAKPDVPDASMPELRADLETSAWSRRDCIDFDFKESPAEPDDESHGVIVVDVRIVTMAVAYGGGSQQLASHSASFVQGCFSTFALKFQF